MYKNEMKLIGADRKLTVLLKIISPANSSPSSIYHMLSTLFSMWWDDSDFSHLGLQIVVCCIGVEFYDNIPVLYIPSILCGRLFISVWNIELWTSTEC